MRVPLCLNGEGNGGGENVCFDMTKEHGGMTNKKQTENHSNRFIRTTAKNNQSKWIVFSIEETKGLETFLSLDTQSN